MVVFHCNAAYFVLFSLHDGYPPRSECQYQSRNNSCSLLVLGVIIFKRILNKIILEEETMKEHYLQLACGQTFLVEEGEGKETIMFLHGSGPGANAVSNWRFALPFFANNYRCLAPDLLGFGHSNAPKEITGVKAWLPFWLRQCIEILDYFGLDKVHLVGNSMGGGIALHLWRNTPSVLAAEF
jgi:hypothetical protein